MRNFVIYGLILLCVSVTADGAADYFVRTDGNDASNGLSWATAKATVQAAVDVAGDGDTVSVSNGTHAVSGQGIVVTNDITIRGVNGPEATILDAGGVSPRRIFLVDSPGARIEGITAANGDWKLSTDGGGALRILSGLVTNCIIAGSRSYVHGGVYLGGGTLVDCIVRNCNSGSSGPGGVYLLDGVVVNCTITNNVTGWNGINGGGMRVIGGIVSNSLISANTVGRSGESSARGGGVYQTGGLVVNCEITGNLGHTSGGGVYQAGGILRNALLTGNNSGVEGGGLYLTAGAVENCSVIGNNTALGDSDGIWMSGGTVSNSIAYLNPGNNLYQGGGSVAYSCINPKPLGEGNLGDDPDFVDAPNGDYRLSVFSPCANTGSNQSWMAGAVDLDGNARLVSGSVDMGAYERAAGAGGPLQCTFSAPTITGVETLDVTFTAQVAGDDTNNVTYTWDFGDTTGATGTDKRVVSHSYGPGYFTVVLTVSNAIVETATKTRTQYIQVMPTTCYVSTNGSNIAPYETWERAASSVGDAVAVGAPTVLISNGTYAVSGEGIVVTRDMTIRGVNGPEMTILDAGGVSPRRIFLVNSAGARIEGITASNGRWNSSSGGGGALWIQAGLVTNCIVTASGSYVRGGVWVDGGTLTDCIVRNCNSLSSGPGGVRIEAGAVLNCTITNNVTAWNGTLGGGMYVIGGMVSNSLISANTVGTSGQTGPRGGGVYQTGGVIVNCEIAGNLSHASGGGVYQAGGILRNSLLAHNNGTVEGGGLYLTAGAVENCTVVENDTAIGDGDGIWMSGGTVSNSIAYLNTGSNLDTNGGSVAYSCIAPLPAGDGNLGDDPAFVDAPNRDYRLSVFSPCVDAGSNQVWMASAVELDGNARLVNGRVDMGAYESSGGAGGPLQCTFSAPTITGFETLDVTFTAQVAGDDTNNVTYTWDFGDTTGTSGTDKKVVSHTYGPGYFTVVLTASNGIAETATQTRTDYIQVVPTTCYVSTNGSNIAPYETWERAASSVGDAVAVGAPTVLISNGTYSIVGEGIAVNRDMTIRGVNGREATILDAGGVTPRRIFLVSSPGARIEGITAANGKWHSSAGGGGALRILSGLVTNCIITGSRSYKHGAVYLGGGTLVDCIVRNCDSGSTGPGGIMMDMGAVLNCTITNSFTGPNGSSGGGLYVAGGVVSNCLISANTGLSTAAGGVYETGGLIVNCEITDNISPASGGGIRQTGGILRNTLLTGNSASAEGGGLYLTAGAVENCTVVGNDTVAGDGDGIWMSGGTVSNSIAYFNDGNNLDQNGGSVAYSCIAPLPAGDGNLGDDPAFVDAPNRDYRLSDVSPCVDAGANQAWMADAPDLDGNPRLGGSTVDMGVYEVQPAAGTVILMR